MKILTLPALCILLAACGSSDYHRSTADINNERNRADAIVTTASIEQQRRQRQNELEEAILRRKQDSLAAQSRQEKNNVVTDTIGNAVCVLGSIIGACR